MTYDRQDAAASALANLGAGSLELGSVGNGLSGCDDELC